MAEQCIVCLEILDSAAPPPLQQLQGNDGRLPADLSEPSLVLAVAPYAAATATTDDETDTTIQNSPGPGEANLDNNDHIAVIQICGHILHDSCLREWTVKANSCPFCRQAFHLVEVYDKIGGNLLTKYTVEDKKQVAEFDPLAWLDENPEEEEETTPCPVCNTADHEDVLLLCDGCDTPYHTHCIGLEDVPEGAWFCMECADRNGIALPQMRAAVARASSRGRNRGRRNGFFPRTQASMRTERTRARTDQWLGAWGQFSDRVHGALGIDLDSNEDEDGGDGLREYRRSQQTRESERREWLRWQQRLSIASRAGARDAFVRNIQGVVEHRSAPRRATPVAQEESPEARAAWRAFERARAATPNGRKRKSRSTTASPVEPQPEPSRPLKRPRTRRIPNQAEAGSSNAASAIPSHHANERTGTSSIAPSPPLMEEAPSFLSTLLKEVEQSAPSDDETVRSVFGLPPVVDPSSPVASPAGSARNSPRAMSLTPPPPQSPASAARSGSRSPVLSLSSHIEPIYPPANYSPTRSHGDMSDSESRAQRKRNGSPELRQPRPQRPLELRLSRSNDSLPTRKTLPLEVKDSIMQVVRAALRPHWKSSQLSREQYEAINRSVSHKLYDDVADPAAVNEEAKRHWEKTATTEVARAIAELKSS
ncbi:unnamed protein product [Discula destructiva]